MPGFLIHELLGAAAGGVDQPHRLRVGGRRTVGVETAVDEQQRPIGKPVRVRLRRVFGAPGVAPGAVLGLPAPGVGLEEAGASDHRDQRAVGLVLGERHLRDQSSHRGSGYLRLPRGAVRQGHHRLQQRPGFPAGPVHGLAHERPAVEAGAEPGVRSALAVFVTIGRHDEKAGRRQLHQRPIGVVDAPLASPPAMIVDHYRGRVEAQVAHYDTWQVRNLVARDLNHLRSSGHFGAYHRWRGGARQAYCAARVRPGLVWSG